jgi:hypothetical protein
MRYVEKWLSAGTGQEKRYAVRGKRCGEKGAGRRVQSAGI